MKMLMKAVAFATAMLTASSAFAASALVTNDLNLRTGPGTGYARIAAMPNGAIVDVVGCTRGYNWCRVHWRGRDGWASSHYLAQREGQYRRRAYSNYGAEIGIPLIAGAVIGGALIGGDHHHYRHYRHDRHHGRYDRRHYRGRDHHRGRDHYRGRHFGHRDDNRCRGGYLRHHGNC
ncbi:SH3 domain-containing protein [Pararhizobium mangrovi]|nr:SH3 domain-containing protein [Pararhizobium mangrovi]